jgi:hypothetical protein
MSPTCPRTRLAVLVLALCVARPAAAQPAGDVLDAARQRREVEAQRVERRVREGRDYAYRAVRTDPARALERIRTLLDLLTADESLSPARRDLLTRTLNRDVSYLQALAGPGRPADAGARTPPADPRRVEDPRRTAGPGSAYDAARARIDAMNSHVADAHADRTRSAERFAGVGRDVDTSAQLPKSDYDLPKDWVEKSKRRSTAPKLTEGEKALLQTLKQPMSVEFNNDTFSSIIEFFQKKTGLTILVDKPALEEANVSYDTPVTLRLPKVSTRTVLRRLLADLGLTYVIKDEAIQITTPARAKDMMVTRVYPIGDLIGTADFGLPAVLNNLQASQAINTIINSIKSNIDPQSWQGENGGTIVFDPITLSLVVKAPAEVHYMLGGKP